MKHKVQINLILIASSSLILGVIIGYFLSNSNFPVTVGISENQSTEITDEDFETEGCDWFSCLFVSDDGSITAGYATVEGYYSEFETEDRNGDPVTCDAFVMTDGAEELIDDFWYVDDAVSAFGIYLDRLPVGQRKQIINSTSTNLIKVNIISQYQITGKGADACYSFERIVGVQESL